MPLLNDVEIKKLVVNQNIKDGVKELITLNKGASYGVSSYGYDVRLDGTLRELTNADIKCAESNLCKVGGVYVMKPHSFILGSSVEHFSMPENMIGLVVGKSTYARVGIQIETSILEPGWKGNINLFIHNNTPYPAPIYIREGIAQVLFIKGDMCKVSYADRKGKYQNSLGPVESV